MHVVGHADLLREGVNRARHDRQCLVLRTQTLHDPLAKELHVLANHLGRADQVSLGKRHEIVSFILTLHPRLRREEGLCALMVLSAQVVDDLAVLPMLFREAIQLLFHFRLPLTKLLLDALRRIHA